MEIKIPEKVTNIMAHLISHGYEAYVVGGAIRSTLLNEKPNDWDLFTDCQDLIELFPDAKIIGGEERQEKILTVIVDGIEVSSYRSNGDRTETGYSLTAHQKTCDLTFNSIACDINGKIVDTQRGVNDLNNKILRFVGDAADRIAEDPLRVLRFLRFRCKYKDFKVVDYNSFAFERDINHLKKDFPQERVREELLKILSLDNISDVYLFELFLVNYFDNFEDCNHLSGGKYHDEPVGEHLLNSLNHVSKITNNPLLRFATLFHDIGKAESKLIKDDGLHFYNHEVMGVDIVKKVMVKLKFSKADIVYVTRLIKSHMYAYISTDKPSKKSHIRFFAKLERDKVPIEDFIMLIYSDHQGNLAKPRIKFGDFIKGNHLYKKYFELKYSNEPFKVSDLEVSGKDIMEILNVSPGPIIGDTLREIFNKVLDGKLENIRKDLLKYLRDRGKIR